MKKGFIIAVAVLLINSAFGQQKADTINADLKNIQPDSTIQITMSLNDYRAVLREIDNSIDSKTVTTRLLQFFQRSARLVEAEKPKPPTEQKPKSKQ